nr:MAG TPA: hypothetical protein [Caudoviricetes sp.]
MSNLRIELENEILKDYKYNYKLLSMLVTAVSILAGILLLRPKFNISLIGVVILSLIIAYFDIIGRVYISVSIKKFLDSLSIEEITEYRNSIHWDGVDIVNYWYIVLFAFGIFIFYSLGIMLGAIL